MRFSPPSPKRVARAISAAAASYFVFWACAPPSSLPPPVPMAAGTSKEIGAAVIPAADIYRGDPCPGPQECDSKLYADPLVDAQLWYSYELDGGDVTMGATLYGGFSSAAGGGGFVRVRFNDNPDFFIGGQIDGGWLWGSVGVPMAWRLRNDMWLYTNPSAGLRIDGYMLLPVGATIPLKDDWNVNVEYSVTDLLKIGYFESTISHISLGASKRW